MTSDEIVALAERFGASLDEGTDNPSFRTPGAVLWHNHDEIERPLAAAYESMRTLRALVADLHRTDVRIDAFDTGCAIRFVLDVSLRDGRTFRIPSCAVLTVSDGLIARVDEYADGRQIEDMSRALMESAAST